MARVGRERSADDAVAVAALQMRLWGEASKEVRVGGAGRALSQLWR